MYLHLGGNTVVSAAAATIVDARLLGAEANRRFLEQAIATGHLKEGGLPGAAAARRVLSGQRLKTARCRDYRR